MQDLVDALVKNYRDAARVTSNTKIKRALGEQDLALYDTWIKQAHSYFREASNQELTITPASEWVLDNYYIIRQTLTSDRRRSTG